MTSIADVETNAQRANLRVPLFVRSKGMCDQEGGSAVKEICVWVQIYTLAPSGDCEYKWDTHMALWLHMPLAPAECPALSFYPLGTRDRQRSVLGPWKTASSKLGCVYFPRLIGRWARTADTVLGRFTNGRFLRILCYNA